MRIFLLLCIFLMANKCNAQILKKVGDKVKRDAEWRARYKADREVNKGIDSLIAAPKKASDKKKTAKSENKTATTESHDKNEVAKNNISVDVQDENDMTPKDGFISVFLSANQVFAGGTIIINGESVKYKNYTQVEITVTGPSAKDTKSIQLSADGKYKTAWIAANKAGKYTVTVKSSDKKAQQSAIVNVYTLPQLSNWSDDNIEEINKAYDKLKNSAAEVEEGISPKDKAELEKKMGAVKESVDEMLKLFNDLNTAGKETAQLVKSGKKLSPNFFNNLSELNNNMTDQRQQMKAAGKLAEHEPLDNTICEYIVILNEACAAFQTVTNFWAKTTKATLINIIADKAAPSAVGAMNEATINVSQPADFFLKEPAKIYANSKLDAESLSSKLGKVGLAADVAQFALDVLLKTYCGVIKGKFEHDYTIEFRTNKGENWWTYGVKMKAVLFLRYPKEKSKGEIIKMKGNLEGNGTEFDFFEDVEKEEGFQEGSKGKIEVVPIVTYTPFAVSEATSARDILGFGAIARGLATPAYFNIPIDAEYDVDAGKIKIFINEAIIDFTPNVRNEFVFLLVGGDLFPYIKHMSFPIHKARVTINSVMRDHNEFIVTKDAKGNLMFNGKGNKHLGNKTDKIEHDLNFSISAKKE